ncbi:MAG TPA: hypothetical protein PKM85_01945 [Candidatus Pacearchaeota archaeon]|nr:hypothetical protein [Candidatus Pacearchaeota archaeon]
MKIYFIPKTIYGKWLIVFSIALIILISLSSFLQISGEDHLRVIDKLNFLYPRFLDMLDLIIFLTIFVSFVTGILTIKEGKDYSIFVFLALIFIFYIIASFVRNIIFPHRLSID